MERLIVRKQNDIDTCGGDWIDRAFGQLVRHEIVVSWPAGRPKVACKMAYVPQIQPPFYSLSLTHTFTFRFT